MSIIELIIIVFLFFRERLKWILGILDVNTAVMILGLAFCCYNYTFILLAQN